MRIITRLLVVMAFAGWAGSVSAELSTTSIRYDFTVGNQHLGYILFDEHATFDGDLYPNIAYWNFNIDGINIDPVNTATVTGNEFIVNATGEFQQLTKCSIVFFRIQVPVAEVLFP